MLALPGEVLAENPSFGTTLDDRVSIRFSTTLLQNQGQ